MPQSDTALLDAWAAGDRAAAAALTQRHFDGLYGFFRSRLAGEVDDLVQESLLRALEARRRGTVVDDLRAYLFAVARNLLHDRLRQTQRNFDATVTSLAELGPTPSAALAHREQERLLLEALRTIPVDFQILLELHYWERMSGARLAQVFDVPEGTVRTRLRRAKTLLTERVAALAGRALTLHDTQTRLEEWAARRDQPADSAS